VYSINGPDDFGPGPTSPPLSGGLSRSQTVLRREGAGTGRSSTAVHAGVPYEHHSAWTPSPAESPSPAWTPDFSQLPTPNEQHETDDDDPEFAADPGASMTGAHHNIAPGKTSSDSGQGGTLDRWSQRRLQRLNTEQGFREQRQGGQGPNVLSPAPSTEQQQQQQPTPYSSSSAGTSYSIPAQEAQPQPPLHHQQPQPHPAQQVAYQSSRTVQGGHPNAGLAIQTQPANTARSPSYQQAEPSQAHVQPSQQQQYSPPDAGPSYHTSSDPSRPPITSRSYSQQQPTAAGADDASMTSNNGGLPAPKAVRTNASNRQSVHNGMTARDGNGQQGVPAFNASVVPPAGQNQAYQAGQPQQKGDVGRVTPQPSQLSEDMSEEDVNQLIKDHKELRKPADNVNLCPMR
jgi:hypothetical protein